MPMHDWTKVNAGIFHHFHQKWISFISDALNEGLLPSQFYALVEQVAMRDGSDRIVPDVIALEYPTFDGGRATTAAATALEARPSTSLHYKSDLDAYRRKKNVVSIRHVSDDRVIAMIEIVSPGNKSSRNAFREFIEKSADLISRGIHLLVIDPFPATRRDPDGIHAAILEELDLPAYAKPEGLPLTFASYEAHRINGLFADVRHIAIGDELPDMPVFLASNGCVKVPMESTYESAWQKVPERWRQIVTG